MSYLLVVEEEVEFQEPYPQVSSSDSDMDVSALEKRYIAMNLMAMFIFILGPSVRASARYWRKGIIIRFGVAIKHFCCIYSLGLRIKKPRACPRNRPGGGVPKSIKSHQSHVHFHLEATSSLQREGPILRPSSIVDASLTI